MECGGFAPVNTNEDMLMAARSIAVGHKVAYEPSAAVYHSHNLTPGQQFRRNREVGAFLAAHAGELMGASEIGEGGRLCEGRLRAAAPRGAARGIRGVWLRLRRKASWKQDRSRSAK